MIFFAAWFIFSFVYELVIVVESSSAIFNTVDLHNSAPNSAFGTPPSIAYLVSCLAEKHVPAPPWSTPGSTSSSAAKKLFPDISVPQTVPLHSGVGAGE